MTPRSAIVGTSRSMPIIATCTRGSGRRQPAVALVGHDAEAAGLGDAEVHAADAHVGAKELGPQQRAARTAVICGTSATSWAVAPSFCSEQRGDLLFASCG